MIRFLLTLVVSWVHMRTSDLYMILLQADKQIYCQHSLKKKEELDFRAIIEDRQSSESDMTALTDEASKNRNFYRTSFSVTRAHEFIAHSCVHILHVWLFLVIYHIFLAVVIKQHDLSHRVITEATYSRFTHIMLERVLIKGCYRFCKAQWDRAGQVI